MKISFFIIIFISLAFPILTPVIAPAADNQTVEAVTGQMPGQADTASLLGALGMSKKPTISVGYIFACIIFNGIGFIAFMYGKKNSSFPPMMTGIALMAYTYLVQNLILLYVIGIALCFVLYVWRD